MARTTDLKLVCMMIMWSVGTAENGETPEYKIPVYSGPDIHALQWALRNNGLGHRYEIEEYNLKSPMYTITFNDGDTMRTLTGLTREVAVWLRNELLKAGYKPNTMETTWVSEE